MTIVGYSGRALTIRMTPDQQHIIGQTIVTYLALKTTAVFRRCHPPHLAHIEPQSLCDKIISQYTASDPEVPVFDEVFTTLDVTEWGSCLFILNVAAYGCAISANDLYCLSGFRHSEVGATMVALHDQIEKHVYKLAATESIRLRRESVADGE